MSNGSVVGTGQDGDASGVVYGTPPVPRVAAAEEASLDFSFAFAGLDAPPAADRRGLREYAAGFVDAVAEAATGVLPKRWRYWRQLRMRFMQTGLDGLSDRELLEILLAYTSPAAARKASLARELIDRFGNLAGVMSADPRRLCEFPAESRRATYLAVCLLKAVQVAGVRLARAEVVDRPVIGSYSALLDYCQARMAHDPVEQFRLLFLNRKNILIADELQGRGTVDHVPLYPREVLKRCLEIGASAIIMVHNHPSGDPTPSAADIEMTKQVATALKLLDIAVHDHIVIGRGRHSSFRSLGLLT